MLILLHIYTPNCQPVAHPPVSPSACLSAHQNGISAHSGRDLYPAIAEMRSENGGAETVNQ